MRTALTQSVCSCVLFQAPPPSSDLHVRPDEAVGGGSVGIVKSASGPSRRRQRSPRGGWASWAPLGTTRLITKAASPERPLPLGLRRPRGHYRVSLLNCSNTDDRPVTVAAGYRCTALSTRHRR
ncbi:hypothetical protein EYF80_050590 [Liparis tanakae]|uniref:Uncharacterized protein n=1 Tax=Liparis tanakae TaxID=230148 RepID=A0A4Z2FFP2_9TELE|nr:hypothetical protein EYF80_050590 [Liparis tanakae]